MSIGIILLIWFGAGLISSIFWQIIVYRKYKKYIKCIKQFDILVILATSLGGLLSMIIIITLALFEFNTKVKK